MALTPENAVQLVKLSHVCVIDAREAAGFSDADYMAAAVELVKTAAALRKAADWS